LTDSTALFLLADDLRVLHSAFGVRARFCHDPAHTSASSLSGLAKGLRVRDFDLAHLLLGHLRAALADAERGEGDVNSLGVGRNLLFESVHVDNHVEDLGGGEGVRLAARDDHQFLAQRVFDQQLHDASATFPVAPSTTTGYCIRPRLHVRSDRAPMNPPGVLGQTKPYSLASVAL
jgi:hypothetical protein